jgi:predicted  nucleic acid-binding Zn-ribbon protein
MRPQTSVEEKIPMTPEFDREQIRRLIQLQQIQNDMRSVRVLLSKTDSRIEALDLELATMREGLDRETEQLSALNQQCRSHESEIKINVSKIEKSEQKLRSVKTNKEYQSSLKEIDDLNRLNSELEDRTLECMERIDQLEKALNLKRSENQETAAHTESEKSQILREAGEARQKLAVLESDAENVSREISPELLYLFDQIKRKHPDQVGIAAVVKAVCQGCNLNIPPQIYNELHRWNSLKRCPNCERIIYVGESNQRPE